MKRLLVFTFLLATVTAWAQDILPRPNPPRLVNDQAQVFTADQLNALERKLVAYDDSTTTQIVIITIPSTNGFPIEDYALQVLRDWGVGSKKNNNGVVLLAAIKDRKITIQTGYGLEGAIPDLVAKTIIDNEIVPNLKNEDYYRGFDRAVDAIIKAAAGQYKAPDGYRKHGKGGGGGSILGVIIIFIIVLVILSRINRGGGGGGGMMNRSGILPWLVINSFLNSGRGGGGGWSGGGGSGWGGGGGGFGGFGGGSGGGGGASGSW